MKVAENQDELVSLFVRIPIPLRDEFNKICKSKRRSQASMIQELLENYVHKYNQALEIPSLDKAISSVRINEK
tara:strand:- start:221 stop:439 length:219 start_codon:yes stop_codon:yes gene_type:complete